MAGDILRPRLAVIGRVVQEAGAPAQDQVGLSHQIEAGNGTSEDDAAEARPRGDTAGDHGHRVITDIAQAIREVAIMRLSFLARAMGYVRMRNVVAGVRATPPTGPGLGERGRPRTRRGGPAPKPR